MSVHLPRTTQAISRSVALVASAATIAALGLVATAAPAAAAVTLTVNPASTDWSGGDTRPGGSHTFTDALGAPDGFGSSSLKLATTDGAAKVQFFSGQDAGQPLSDLSEVGYSTHRSSTSTGPAFQVPAVNVVIDFNGPDPGGFSTLVFEPIYTYGAEAIEDNIWQSWDASGAAKWWSTKVMPGVCAFDCFVPLDDIMTANPDATITAYGFNLGSGNPGIIAAVDALMAGEKTFDFEALAAIVVDDDGAGTADDCDAATPAFTTIQAAADFATAGDTVNVCAGEYAGATVNKQLTFLGAQAGLDARTGRTDMAAESVVQGVLNANGVSGTTIDGFWFTGASSTPIALVGGSGHTVVNTVIADNTAASVQHAIVYVADGTSPTRFAQNRVTSNYLHGFFATGEASDVTIEDNAFANNGSSVVHFAPPPGVSSNVVVRNNTSTDDANFLVGSGVNDLTGTGNTVNGTVGTGMLFGGDFSAVTLSGNTVTDSGGSGIAITPSFGAANTAFTITENTIMGNQRGIQLSLNGYTGTAEVHFNRLVGNASEAAGRVGIRNQSSGAVNAENNWWGCNEGPSTADCDADPGFVDSSPWLVLTTTADPSTVTATSIITADLTINSAGVDTSVSGFSIPPTPVTFATDMGQLSTTTGTTDDGTATTTLSRAGAIGDATVSSTVDFETASTTVTFVEPDLSVADTSVGEGDGDAEFTVSLDAPNDEDVTFDYATSPGTADANDFTATMGTGTIVAGDTSTTVLVPVTDDTVDEPSEAFTLTISNGSVEITNATAIATIIDNDAKPVVSVGNDRKVTEGGKASFTITLAGSSSSETSVEVTTQNGTAKAPGDFVAVTKTVVFAPGETTATVKVQTNLDQVDEGREKFKLLLSGPDGLTLGDKSGVATIRPNVTAARVQAGSGV